MWGCWDRSRSKHLFTKGNRALLAASKISTGIPHTLTKSALMPEKVDMAFFTTNLAQCNSNTQWRGGKPYHLSLTILTLFSSVSPVIYVTFLDDWGECWVISVVGHFQYYMYQDHFPLNCRLLFVFVLYFSLLDKLVFTVWKTADTMQCRYTCNHGPRNKVLVLFHFYKIQTLLCFRQQSKSEEDV